MHAATIEYLSTHFGLSPGVEEACLYHAMQLKDPQEILPWLLKCTGMIIDRSKLFDSTSLILFLYIYHITFFTALSACLSTCISFFISISPFEHIQH